MKTNIKTFVLFFGLMMAAMSASAQSDSLQVRYDELMQKSETYEQFKVIRTTRLDALWGEVQDSIRVYQRRLSSAAVETDRLSSKIDELEGELTQIKTNLDETEAQLGQISFLGADVNVTLYHTIVWAIILALAVLIVIVYGMFLRANAVTRTTSNDLAALKDEFEQLKERSREREIKIKRELQTTLNTLEEYKRGVKK